MMSRFRKRHWPLSLLVIAVLASLLSVAPPAHASNGGDAQAFELSYDCLQGQTVTLVPGQVRIPRLAEDGVTMTYATIISDRIDVWPHEWGNDEDAREQLELQPGTQSNFHPETDLPLNPTKVVRFTYQLQWEGSSGSAEYLPSQFQCIGTPTDGDGDGIPDELDGCPAQAAPESPDGCPSGVTIVVTGTTPGDQATGAVGSATVNVTNVADGAGTENYQVWLEDQSQATSLADGATSSLTFTGLPGDWSICAQSSTRAVKSCAMATIPNQEPSQPDYAGTVVYEHTCYGLRYTIANTGTKPIDVSIMLTWTGNSSGYVTVWRLEPGQSRSAKTPMYYNATIRPRIYAAGGVTSFSQVLTAKRWYVASSCPIWMVGGTSLVKWGVLSKYSGRLRPTINTKAYHAMVGFQIKGSSRVYWRDDFYRQGRHIFETGHAIKRGRKVTIRLWVRYNDSSEVTTYGKVAFTGWHTYRRP